MEKLKKKYASMLQALATFKQALDFLEEPHPEKYHISLSDSLIQRFEYNIDTFWKLLKLYLQEYEKMDIEAASPRGVIRQAMQANIILPEEQDALLKAIENRNLTSHSYNQHVADEIISDIPETYTVLSKILHRMSHLT